MHHLNHIKILWSVKVVEKTLEKKLFGDIVGKGESVVNQPFLITHNVFYPIE